MRRFPASLKLISAGDRFDGYKISGVAAKKGRSGVVRDRTGWSERGRSAERRSRVVVSWRRKR